MNYYEEVAKNEQGDRLYLKDGKWTDQPVIAADEDGSQMYYNGDGWLPYEAPKDIEPPTVQTDETDGDIIRGGQNVLTYASIVGNGLTGDKDSIATNIFEHNAYTKANPASKDQQNMMREFDAADGLWDSAKVLLTNPSGTIDMTQEQFAQYGLTIPMMKAGALTGGLIGSVATPAGTGVGTVIGGVAGGYEGAALSSAVIEYGANVMQDVNSYLADKGLEPSQENIRKALDTDILERNVMPAVTKGQILGLFDIVGLKVGHALKLGKPARELEKASASAMRKFDLTPAQLPRSAAAQAELKPFVDAVKNDLATTATKVKRGAGAVGVGGLSEGSGEYVGQGLAYDEWDAKNALLESVIGLGGEVAQVGLSGTLVGAGKAKEAADNLLRSKRFDKAGEISEDTLAKSKAAVEEIVASEEAQKSQQQAEQVNAEVEAVVQETVQATEQAGGDALDQAQAEIDIRISTDKVSIEANQTAQDNRIKLEKTRLERQRKLQDSLNQTNSILDTTQQQPEGADAKGLKGDAKANEQTGVANDGQVYEQNGPQIPVKLGDNNTLAGEAASNTENKGSIPAETAQGTTINPEPIAEAGLENKAMESAVNSDVNSMSQDDIKSEIDKIGKKIEAARNELAKDSPTPPELIPNDLDLLSPNDVARLQELKQALPSSAQEAIDAKARNKARIAERNKKRAEANTEVLPSQDEVADVGIIAKNKYKPTAYADLSQDDKVAIAQKWSNELTEGGGIAYTTDENGNIDGKTSSSNPDWFKDGSMGVMNLKGDNVLSTQPSVKRVKDTVSKLTKGDTLTKREERIIEALVDQDNANAEEGSEQATFQEQDRIDGSYDETTLEAASETLDSLIEEGVLTEDMLLTMSPAEVDSAEREYYEQEKAKQDGANGEVSSVSKERKDSGNQKEAEGAKEESLLTDYSQDDLNAKEEAEIKQAKEKAASDKKANIDADADNFTLTGSDRAADANTGQSDVFSEAVKKENDPNADKANVTDNDETIAKQNQEKIEDFGEVLHGAAKHTYHKLDKALGGDIDVATVPLSKSFPLPDYVKMIADGVDPLVVTAIAQLRAEIKPKKRKRITKSWIDSVNSARARTKALLSGVLKPEDIYKESVKDAKSDLNKLGSEILPEQIKALAEFEVHKHLFNLFKGEKDVIKWTVSKVHSGSMFGAEAHFDTKKEALSHVKSRVADVNEKTGKAQTKLDMWSERGKSGVFLGKKVASRKFIELKHFDTQKEATEYRDSHYDELIQLLAEKKKLRAIRRIDNNPRVGVDYRDGEDVTAELFADTFGFRGVQFGNWVEGGRRQQDLNNAYDALMDLSGIINVPPKALSLNGTLGLAFGARGRGGIDPAAAHYESDNLNINLTKINGSGSLAHEVFHAIDNYFGNMDKSTEFLSEGGRPIRKQSKHPDGYVKMVKTTGEDFGVRQEVYDAWKKLTKAIKDETKLVERSIRRDNVKGKDYWSTVREMTARSFERYVIDKLEAKGYSSDYLANIVSEKEHNKINEILGDDEAYAYPLDSEMEAVNNAYDKLFSVLETKETDKGVALFSKKPTNPTTSLSVDAVEAIVSNFRRKVKGVGITVHASESTLPKVIRDAAKKQDAEGTIYGVYYDGEVHIIASKMRSEKDVEGVIFHEVYGHYGARIFFGKDLKPEFNRLYLQLQSKGVQKIAEDNGIDMNTYLRAAKDMPYEQRAQYLVDELLAHLQEKSVTDSLPVKAVKAIKAFIGAIRAQLRKLGFAKLSEIGETDLFNVLNKMKQAAEEGAKNKRGKRSDPLFMVAYHGSPHDLNKFDSSKIGTGEGGQAYGYGLYFAGKKEVAEHYKEVLGGDEYVHTVDGVEILEDELRDMGWASKNAINALGRPDIYQPETMVDRLLDDGASKEKAEELSAALEKYAGKVEFKRILKGTLYQVDLAPKETEYLLWDKPLSDQSEFVTKALEKQFSLASFNEDFRTAGEFYNSRRRGRDNGEKASKQLQSLGIRGIKYLDGSSRGAGEGDYNYVIFSDDDITITHKNDESLFSRESETKEAHATAQKNAAFDPMKKDSPDLLFSRKSKVGKNTSWRDEKGYEDVSEGQLDALSKFSAPPNPPLVNKVKEKYEDTKDRFGTKFRQEVLDQYDSIKSVLDDKRAWMLAQMAGSAGGAIEMVIQKGHLLLDKSGVLSIDTAKKGLAETLAPLGDESNRFLQWVAANRAERLWAEDKENLLTETDIQELLNLNKSTTEGPNAWPEREQVYAEVLKDFEALHNSVVQVGVDSGLISKEDAALWAEQGFYVPFYRIAEEDGDSHGISSVSGMVGQEAYKKLKGANMQLEDLLLNTVMNWEHIATASLKNQAATAALDSAAKMGLAREVEGGKPPKVGKNHVYVRENGQEKWYYIEDSTEGKLIIQSLGALNFTGLNNAPMKVLRKFKRLLTIGVTASPEFKIANLIRDTIQAIAVAPMNTNFLKNIHQGWGLTEEMSQERIQAVAAGGLFGDSGYINGGDPDAIKMVMAKGIGQAEILDTEHKVKKWWNKYQDLGARLENVNRSANIQQSIDKGKDKLTANFEGRDHLDFQRSGANVAVRVLTQTIPFLNARAQGLDKLGRALADPAQRKQAMAVIGAYAMASVLLYLYMKDDDDYKEAEQWERDTYHLIKLPATDKIVRIPRPFEVGALANIVERGVEQFVDKDADMSLFYERMSHMLTETLAFSVLPQALAPAMDIRANKSSFTGRQIESLAMQRLSPTNRVKPWTTQSAIGLSKLLSLPMGDSGLSPIQIDFLVKQYTGWMGATILNGVDLIARPATGKASRPEMKIQDYPVIGRFIREGEGRNSKYITELYDNRAFLAQKFADIKHYKANKEMDKFKSAREKYGKDLRHRSRYNKASLKLSKLSNEIKKITDSKIFSASEKSRRIDRINSQRLMIARRLVLSAKLENN